MTRRALLISGVIGTLLLTSCTLDTPTDQKPEAPVDADQILAAAGWTAPPLETTVREGPVQGTESWSRIVVFSGPATEIENWIEENFPEGIESVAYQDDMAVAVEQLGDGVQKKGDRLASGVVDGEGIAFVVVVGQGDEPVVHAAVRRTGR